MRAFLPGAFATASPGGLVTAVDAGAPGRASFDRLPPRGFEVVAPPVERAGGNRTPQPIAARPEGKAT